MSRIITKAEFSELYDLEKVKQKIKDFIKDDGKFNENQSDEDYVYYEYKTLEDSLQIDEIQQDDDKFCFFVTLSASQEISFNWEGNNFKKTYTESIDAAFIVDSDLDIEIEQWEWSNEQDSDPEYKTAFDEYYQFLASNQ